jgi:hypothetical protein
MTDGSSQTSSLWDGFPSADFERYRFNVLMPLTLRAAATLRWAAYRDTSALAEVEGWNAVQWL